MGGVFVAGGRWRVDLPRVWENAVEGDKRRVMNKVMAMRFKGVSPSTVLGLIILWRDCTKDQRGW